MAMPRPNEAATYSPGHALGYDPGADLDALFEDFIDASVSIINDNTEKTYRTDYRRFRAWLVDNAMPVTTAALEKPVLVRYVTFLRERPNLKPGRRNRQKLSTKTLNTYLRPIRTFARYLVAEGRLPRDPLWGPRSPMPQAGPRESKAPTAIEVAALDVGTQGSEPLRLRDRVLFLLALDDGSRLSEILRLRIGDLHLDEGYLAIPRAKGDKPRVVPISREVVAVIRRYLRLGRTALTGLRPEFVGPEDVLIVGRVGRPLTPSGAYQAVDAAFARGGGDHPMGPNVLRHLFSSHTQEAGGDPRVVQDILGHSDPKTTRGYAGQTSLARRQAVHAQVTPIRTYLPRRRR